MNTAVIGLGSNINPQSNIQKAKELIASKYNILGQSSFITTKPIGYLHQPNFINGAILIETDLSLEELKTDLKKMENAMGRRAVDPLQKFGPRKIDLDIVVWNNTIIDKDFYQRGYLKKMAKELLPDLKYSSNERKRVEK